MEEKNYTVLSFLYGSGFARLNGIGELEVLQEYFFFSRGKLVHLFDDVNRDRVKTESVKPPLCGTSEQVVDRSLIQIRKLDEI